MRAALVATLVVMAGCVEMLDLGETEARAPNLAFQKHTESASLRLVMADADGDWQDIRAIFDGCMARLNGSELSNDGRMSYGSARARAGHTITLHGDGACEITLVHLPTNMLYDTWTFEL